MSQTAALHQLQTLDSQLDAIHKRLAAIDALLAENEAVRAAQETLDQAKARLTHWKTRQTDLDLERQQLKDEGDAVEQHLYSGKVQNPRELTDLQNKLAELRRRREDLEEPALEALLELEQAEADVAEADAELDRVAAEHAGALSELTAERDSLTAQAAGLQTRIEQTRSQIDPAHLTLYDGLRRRPGGVAVTRLNVGAECGVCGVRLTSQMGQRVRRGEVLPCPTCGRILCV